MQHLKKTVHLSRRESRRGSIFVLATGLLIMIFGFAAFAVDISYISLTRAQLQKSADAAALAAVQELEGGWGAGAELTAAQAALAARTAARDVAFANEGGGSRHVYLDMTRDVRLGQLQWNPATSQWVKSWGTSPYNLVEVTVHRDQVGSSNGDRPLDLFFAPILGQDSASLSVTSVSAMLPGTGLKKIPGKMMGVLPIAVDVQTWNSYMANQIGSDSYRYNSSTKTISTGSDGIKELNIYPDPNTNLPSGNRGTVDFGHSGNSTADIARQILYGLNDSDLAFLGGKLDFDDLPMIINGDTGLSAGIKNELDAIKGQPRMIPLFSQVSGPGNNAMYTIVKFVPIRIVNVNLTGKPSDKRVLVQPAPYSDPSVVTGEKVITQDTIFGAGSLVR